MVQHILIVNILAKGSISDKILEDRTYKIAGSRKYDRYQKLLACIAYKSFNKKTVLGLRV